MTFGNECATNCREQTGGVAEKKFQSKFRLTEFAGEARSFKTASFDGEVVMQARKNERGFSLQRNRQKCSMQIAQYKIAQYD